jgi:hypothetical protein
MRLSRKIFLSTIFICGMVITIAASVSFAQNNPRFIQFSPSAVKGALYIPDSGPVPHVGVLLMHPLANYMSHRACTELSKRGFMVLGMNSRFDNNVTNIWWEEIALDVRQGVDFLRKQPGIKKVVLIGHSGGSPTMTFYQAVAEKGMSYCQGDNKLVPCSTPGLNGLSPADGLILMDAHPGNPIIGTLRANNPAIINETPNLLDPSLDPFNPANGYNPNGPSKYSEEFKTQYYKAQADRMNRLIAQALDKWKKIKGGTYDRFPDDDILVIPSAGTSRPGPPGSATLSLLDPSIDAKTTKPRRLLKNDGTIAEQIIENVKVGDPKIKKESAGFLEGTKIFTIKSFLSYNAIRATDSQTGIDWCSSNNSNVCALQSISTPLLVAAAGGFYLLRDNEVHYEVAASRDKEFIVIEGADHQMMPCTACEKIPGQYANAGKNHYDYVAKWINARF